MAAGVPTIWMGVLPELEGRDTSHLRAIPCGGSAVPRALSEGYQASDRPAHPPGVGHDRDQPHRVRRTHQELPGRRTGRGRAGRSARHHRHRRGRRRLPGGGPGHPRGGAVGRREPRASCRSPARGSRASTTTTTARPSRSPRTATCAPATSSPSTTRATCGSSTGPRTWSSRGASGSARWSWRTRSWVTPTVAEAAVIGVKHPKWSERPLACVVVKPGEELTKDELLDLPRRPGGQVVVARRRRVHRRGAQDLGRQVLEEDAARPVRGLRPPHRLTSSRPPDAPTA